MTNNTKTKGYRQYSMNEARGSEDALNETFPDQMYSICP